MHLEKDGNMYEANATQVLHDYARFVSAMPTQTVLAIGTQAFSSEVQTALGNSAAALGYGRDSCAFLVTSGIGAMAADAAPSDVRLDSLSEKDLMTVTEGLDPLAIMAVDRSAAELLGKAYRIDVPLDAFLRIEGRRVAAFRDFAACLENAEEKQRAWAVLKKLAPKD